jgi:2-amino-4-hydroxy-6-hydroxymethyldihydropteridine diphosphokinase
MEREPAMSTVYLALGSNVGDRQAHLEWAKQAISKLAETKIVGQSEVYETAPVGPQQQGPFLNSVLAIETRLGARLLLHQLQRIEVEAGRNRVDCHKWGPRELDIDILLYGTRRINQSGLTVPHPHLHERWFVLKPLADLAPELVPPGYDQTVQQMLAAVEAEHGSGEAAEAGRGSS